MSNSQLYDFNETSVLYDFLTALICVPLFTVCLLLIAVSAYKAYDAYETAKRKRHLEERQNRRRVIATIQHVKNRRKSA